MAIALGGKLMLVMVKQIAKPIASFVKREAKAHPMLGYPLAIMGGFSHRTTINLGRLVTGKSWLSRGSVATIAPLSKEHAVEQGAELLGECVIFSVVGGTVAIELFRQNRVKEAATQKAAENEMRQWEAFRVGSLERDELRRDVEALKKQLAALEQQLAKRRWL